MSMMEMLKGLILSPADAKLTGRQLLRKTRALVAGLPLIAQAMVAQSNLKIRLRSTHSGGMTDGETVWIQPSVMPLSEMEADEFVVNAALQLGLLHHEVGHVNQTDFKARLPQGIVGTLANILEDVRQENLHIASNRAGRKYLDSLSMAAIITGMHGEVTADDSPLGVFTSYLLYRSRAEFRKEPWFEPLADSAEKVMEQIFPKGITHRLDLLLDEQAKLRSTAEAISLAKRIAAFLQKEKEEAEKQAQQQAGQQGDGDPSQDQSSCGGDGSADAGEQGSDQSSSDGSDSQEGQGDQANGGSGASDQDSNGSSSAPSSSSSGDPQDGNSTSGSGAGGASAQADALQQVIDNDDSKGTAKGDLDDKVRQLLQQRGAELQSRSPSTVLSHDLMLPTAPTPIMCGLDVDLDAAMRASTTIRNKIVDVLQADSLTRNAVGQRGSTLSDKHLVRAATGDPRIFKKVQLGRTVDTAVVFCADVSGSMSGEPVQLLNQALYASTMALQACPGVDVGIVSFPGRGLVLNFGQPARRHRERFSLCAGGGTPLCEGVAHATQLLLSSRKPRKILIVLTDGAPNCAGSAEALIDAAELRGIEVHGLGILTMSVTSLFRSHLVVNDLSELSSKLMGLLKGQLLRAA